MFSSVNSRPWLRFFSAPRIVVREGEEQGGSSPPPPPTSPPPPPTSPPPPPTANSGEKRYSDAEVNEMMSKHKRTLQQGYKTLEEKLTQTLESKTLSDQQRADLEQQLESVRNETKTKEELHKDALKKTQDKYESALKNTEERAKTWESRFSSQTINTALVSAAVQGKARNPDHIVALLGPNSKLVEKMDEDNKPTGVFEVKTKITIQKDGKPVTLELDPVEAVKQLSEQDNNAYMFTDKALPGLGGNGNGSGTSRPKVVDSKTTMEDYAKNIRPSLGLGTGDRR